MLFRSESEGELSNTIEFEISAPANLKWRAKTDAATPNTYDFANLLTGDSHEYEINFGDGSDKITTKESVSHNFPVNESAKTYSVSIKQLGEVCESMQIIVVEIPGHSNPHDFNSPDFNSNDFNTN